MSHRRALKALLSQRSVRLGSFTLASGARSTYYIDARCSTMTAEGQFLCGLACLESIRAAGWRPTHVGGLTMGADPLAFAVAHRSWMDGDPIDAFSVRKQPKEHGTGRQIEGCLPTDATVVVLEDSLTSGGSALRAASAIETHGATVLGILSLVDREEGARARIESAGYELVCVFTAAELLEDTEGAPP